MYMSYDQKASQAVDDTNKILIERQTVRDGLASEDQTAYDAETAAFQTQRQTYVASARKTASYGLYLFGGGYLVSVVESFMFEPSPPKNNKKTKKRRYGSDFRLFPGNDPKTLAALTYTKNLGSPIYETKDELDEQEVRNIAIEDLEYSLGIGSSPSEKDHKPVTITLGVDWQF